MMESINVVIDDEKIVASRKGGGNSAYS
jgi:hypothetical protein